MNNTYIKGRITKGEFVSELFKQRVESKGGTYEANDCLVNSLNSLTDKEFKDAKLILTPNGYVVDKLPTIKPNGGGDATVIRNTTKTRVNSSGLIESMANNILAPDYLNSDCPALNVEGQATNLFEYSEQFDNAYWFKNGFSILANDSVSPDNSITADKATLTIGSGRVVKSVTLDDNKDYILSVFIKNINATNNRVGISAINKAGENSRGLYDLTNEGIVFLQENSTATIKKYNNGFYHCIMKYNSSSGTTLPSVRIITNVSADNGLTLNESVYVWGAELKQENNISSYIPTTTSAVTRSADTVTIPIPAGVTQIIEKYEDGTTNTITTIPALPYTVPTGRYEYILMR